MAKQKTTITALPKSEDYYRRVRTVACELLSVWRIFADIEQFIWSDDPTNALAQKLPYLNKKFLQIDDEKLKQITDYYNQSIHSLKEIDVVLYFKLENKLFKFNRVITEILQPLIHDKEIEYFKKNTVLIDLLRDNLNDLETVIRDTVNYLPKDETKDINKIIDDHLHELDEPKPEEVPQWLLGQLNSIMPGSMFFESNDFLSFYQNRTIAFILGKMMDTGIYQMLYGENPAAFFNIFIDMAAHDTSHINVIAQSPKFLALANNFKFTTDEQLEYFIDNKVFYNLILGFLQMAEGYVPYKVKRDLIKLNNGQISVNQFLPDALTKPIRFPYVFNLDEVNFSDAEFTQIEPAPEH